MAVYIYPPVSVTTLPPLGGATSANQSAEISELQAINSELDNILNKVAKFKKDGVVKEVSYDTATPANSEPMPVNVIAVNGQSVSTTVDLTGAQVNVQLSDRGTSPDSVRVGDGTNLVGVNANNEIKSHDADTLAKLTDIETIDFASEAKQDSILTALAALLTELALKADLTETQPVSGPATDAQLRATPLPISGTVTATPPAQVGSFDEDATLSTTPETFTAPAGAFACFIEADDTNTTNIRVKMGAAASTTSGIQFQPGRSEFYQGGSNVSVCMESGTGKVSVQWFVR